MRHHHQKLDTNGRLIAGIIILVAGLLFLLNNLNILPPQLDYYLFSWKTLLIAIGTLNLLFSHNRTGGFIMITVGLVFWIPDIIDLPMHASRFIWPMAIIAVGLFILFNNRENRFGSRFWEEKIKDHNKGAETSTEGDTMFSQDDYIDEVAIFGGGDRRISSKSFKGGKVTSIFGGSAIHLRHAKLAPGNHKLDLFFLFGGSEIIVPADWVVKVDVVSIFGGFSDKRYVRNPEEITGNTPSVLTIKGLVLFGGGELKTY